MNEPSSVFRNGFAGSTFNYYNTGLPQFSLGGSQRLVAYGINELLMDKYFLFQLGYLRQLAKLPPLLGNGVYFLGVYEAAQVYGPPYMMINKASGFPTDGAVGIVVNTIFGPVEAAYAYGDKGDHNSSSRLDGYSEHVARTTACYLRPSGRSLTRREQHRTGRVVTSPITHTSKNSPRWLRAATFLRRNCANFQEHALTCAEGQQSKGEFVEIVRYGTGDQLC